MTVGAKHVSKKAVAATTTKTPRGKTVASKFTSKPPGGDRKKRRLKSTTVAKREIFKLQKDRGLQMRMRPFSQLVRRILGRLWADTNDDKPFRLEREFILTLQEEMERFARNEWARAEHVRTITGMKRVAPNHFRTYEEEQFDNDDTDDHMYDQQP